MSQSGGHRRDFRHEFVREYLGKIIIGLFIAIAIQNTALNLAQWSRTSLYELKLAAVDVMSEYAARNGRPLEFSMGDVPFERTDLRRDTMFESVASAVDELDTPDAKFRTGLTKADLETHTARRLVKYQSRRWYMFLTLLGVLVLQAWHLYYTCQTFNEIIPDRSSMPFYARLHWKASRWLEVIVLIALFFLTCVVLTIPIFSPQPDGSERIFLGAIFWCALWFLFDLLKFCGHRLYERGRHHLHPMVYAVRRKSPIDNDITKRWLVLDTFLLIVLAIGWLYGPHGVKTYDDLLGRKWQEFAILGAIFLSSSLMLLREWSRSAPKSADQNPALSLR